MGRLIDADALIEVFKDKAGIWTGTAKYFIDVIEKQPTAYDVEKVDSEVNEIAGRIFNYCEEIDNNIPEEERTGYDMLQDIQRLRECVRNGGKE